jgi:hypothetical protein
MGKQNKKFDFVPDGEEQVGPPASAAPTGKANEIVGPSASEAPVRGKGQFDFTPDEPAPAPVKKKEQVAQGPSSSSSGPFGNVSEVLSKAPSTPSGETGTEDDVREYLRDVSRKAGQGYEFRETNPFVSLGKKAWQAVAYDLPATLASTASLLARHSNPRMPYIVDQGVTKEQAQAAEARVKATVIDWAGQHQTKGQEMTKDITDNIKEIKDPIDALNWTFSALGNASGRIPITVATGGATSIGEEVGSIYMEGVQRISNEQGITTEEVIKRGLDRPAVAIAYGTVAGMFDKIGAKSVMGGFGREQFAKSLRGRALSAFEAGLTEGTTEYGQTYLEQLGASQVAGKDFGTAWKEAQTDDAVYERLESAAQGAIGGSGLHVVTQAMSPRETTKVVTENINVRDQSELDAKAEVIQEKADSQEAALAMGAPDVKPVTAQVDEATKADPSATVVQESEQPVVPETQAKEEAPKESEEEVSLWAKVAVRKEVDKLISSGDLSRDENGKVQVLTEKGGKELYRVLEENNIPHKRSGVQYEDRAVAQETDQAKTAYISEDANKRDQEQQAASERGPAAVGQRDDIAQQQAPGQGNVQLQEEVSPAQQPGSAETQTQNVEDNAVQEPSTTGVPVRERTGSSQEVPVGNTEGGQAPAQGQGEETQVQDKQGNAGTIQQPNEQSIDDSLQQRGVSTEVERPSEGNGLPPNSPPKTPERSGKEPIREPELRKTWLRIKDDPDVSDEIKDGISKEAKEYVPRSLRKVTQHEADVIIDWLGNDLATKMYLDDNTGIHHDVDTALGIRLFERLQNEGDFAEAIKVFEKLSVKGTQLGQAVNAYKLLKGKTMLFAVDRALRRNRKDYKSTHESIGVDAKSAIDKINQDAVEKVISSEPVTKAKKSRAASVKKAIDFLDTLKIDTKGKALDVAFGITAAAWNTVITAVQKGLQAGLTISQAIDKAVKTVNDPNFKKKEAIEYLDEKLATYRVTLDPERAIRAELKAQGTSIDDIIRSHYNQQASTKKNLVDKLIKDGNVAPEQAQEIADAIAAKFDDLTRAAKTRALEKIVPKEKKVSEKKRKDTIDKLVDQSNLGALSEEQYLDPIANEIGVPSLLPEQAAEIQRLTDILQNAKGDQQKSKAAQDLYNYIENLKGWSWWDAVESVWFANMLSGPTTWLITNPFANATNLVAEASIDIARNPKYAGFILSRIASGLTRGLIQAGDVLRTGYDPYKGENYKTEATPLLERVTFKGGKINPLNWLKYVTRAIKAGDVIFYQGLKAQRFAVAALNEARKNGRVKPNGQDLKTIYGQLMQSNFKGALAQAESEGLKGSDAKLRAYEIMEEKLPEMAIKEAENFAARATFNMKPEGALGSVAEVLNTMRRKVPVLKVVVPFVNTIINVANEYLNYNPVVGTWRVAQGTMGFKGWGDTYKVLTREERARIMIKTIIGTTAMAALAAMDDEEDKKGKIEITADGTGDTKKNFELQRNGWRPYSIRIGDTWYNYKNTPLAMPLATVGFWKDAARYGSSPDLVKKTEIAMMGSWKVFMDMSTLSGLADFFELMSKDSIADLEKGAAGLFRYLERSAKALIVPNYFTQFSRLVQEMTDTPIKKAQDPGEAIIRDMPVLRDHLNNMYDVFGDPVTPKQMEKFLPFNASRAPEDSEMFNFLADHKLFVESVGRSNLKPNGEPMSDEEYNEFALKSAQAIKKRLMKEYKSKAREKNDEKIKDWFKKVKREERRKVKYKLFD